MKEANRNRQAETPSTGVALSGLRGTISKSLRFAGYGAIGGLLAALIVLIVTSTALPFPTPAKPVRQKVDVLFLLDVTGSMQGEIDGVRDGINDFVQQFTNRDLDAHIGLIGYRDRKVGEQFEIVEFGNERFTDDPVAFSRKVSALVAQGGGDEPESVLDTLALASRQPFRDDADKILILIADAPPHIPDKETPNIEVIAKLLQEKRFRQLNLVIRDADRAVYGPLQKVIPGGVFPLSGSAAGRARFSEMLPKVGEQVASGIKSPLDPEKVFQVSQLRALLLAVSFWTGMLSMGICLALIIGQNRYLDRRLLSIKSGVGGALGSFVAGAVAGATGLLAAFMLHKFGVLATMLLDVAKALPFDIAERFVAWGVLGGLIGAGMASFVPNLKRVRAAAGGGIGGLMGAIGLTWTASLLGVETGRIMGAVILGFFVGLMVGLVEAAFRKFWLDISYGRESRTVNLGLEPVSIGSEQGSCTIYARNAAPVAYRYRLDQGGVVCEDIATGRTMAVSPGDRKVAGIVTITVCAGAKTQAQPQKSVAFSLQLSNGQTVSLEVGTQLMPAVIPGLESRAGSRIIAEVVKNPNDPAVLGLMNLSHRTWSATPVGGEQKQVESGKSVKLAAGTKIGFGLVTGELRS